MTPPIPYSVILDLSLKKLFSVKNLPKYLSLKLILFNILWKKPEFCGDLFTANP